MRKSAMTCTRCSLHETRTNVVWGSGPITSPVKLFGEAPGYDEDKQGFPFIGRTGQFLTGTLIRISDDKEIRKRVFVSNLIMCRPPNNRDPLPAEIKACGLYFRFKVWYGNPKVVGCIGRFAATAIIGPDFVWNVPVEKRGVLFVPIYHPSYVLRKAATKSITDDFNRGIRLILEKGKLA
jgi:uracil-DNA glycosylase